MAELIVQTAVYLLATLGCLGLGALLLNELPFDKPPGFAARLWAYLNTNSAQTRRDHTFPELELPCYYLAPAVLFTRVEQAMELLGWRIVDSDSYNYRIRAIVESRLFRFKDDVTVHLVVGDNGAELHVHSQSRLGRGDFGANSRHIMNLLQILARQA